MHRSCQIAIPVARIDWLLIAALVPFVALAGCGKTSRLVRAPVSGSVAVDGRPLDAGVVRFVPLLPTRGPATVATVKAGRFELSPAEGPVVGTHRIEIEAINYQDFTVDDEQAFAERVQQKKKLPANPIPAKYNRDSAETLELSPEGNSQLEFKIVSRTR